jgi:hypothetical protein
VGGLSEDIAAFEKTLHLIYSRYNENPDKKTFRNKVERMTLINMMLLFQKELGLGRVSSNLYHLLLDLVLHLDPENPDPMDFMREKSLTIYFDDADLDKRGITALRQTLEVQSAQSLENIVTFVSELRGVKYLMDMVASDRDAEVIVVNATADEFLNWMRFDNLIEGQGEHRLRSGYLVKTGSASHETIPPGLIYMTDIAFTSNDKKDWIDGLQNISLQNELFSYLMPPICLSTPPQDKDKLWAEDGERWAKSAEETPVPLCIVGPSPRLNSENDGFPTVLPAGYVFAAHLLMRPQQKLRIDNVGRQSVGRFRIIGYGPAGMRANLDCVLWGERNDDTYAFEVDFYLYIILSIYATAKRKGGTLDPKSIPFFRCFFLEGEEMLNISYYKSSEILGSALIGGNALSLAMDQDCSENELIGVTFSSKRQSLLNPGVEKRNITSVAWFNKARELAGLD